MVAGMTTKKSSSGGSVLKTIREAAGISQRALAEHTGMSSSLVQMIEIGQRKVTPQQARNIAAHLGCNPGDLLEGGGGSGEGTTYSSSVYQRWNSKSVSEQEIQRTAEHAARAIQMLITAASEEGGKMGTNPTHRFREVSALVFQNMDEILKRFDLPNTPSGKKCAETIKWALFEANIITRQVTHSKALLRKKKSES